MSTDPRPPADDAPPLALSVVIARLDVVDAEDVLRSLAGRLLDDGAVALDFPAALRAREQTYPTGLPTPIPTAIPHADPEHVLTPGLALATLAEPVRFGEMGTRDGSVAVRLVAMPLLTDAHQHLAALQRLMGLLSDEAAVQDLLAAEDDEALRARATRHLGAALPGRTSDAGAPEPQAPSVDAPASSPPPADASPADAAPTDAARTDASPTDASPTDAAPTDASPTDAAPTDASPTQEEKA